MTTINLNHISRPASGEWVRHITKTGNQRPRYSIATMLARNPHEPLPLSRTRRPESRRGLERESHCASKQAETRLAATCCTRAMICSGHNPGGGAWYGLLPGLLLSPWSVVLIFHLDGVVKLLFMTEERAEAPQRRAPPAPPPSSHATPWLPLSFHFVGYAQAVLSSDTLGGGGSIEHARVYPDACARAAHSDKKFSNTDFEPWLE